MAITVDPQIPVLSPARAHRGALVALAAAVISAWGCWAVPLLITEAALQGRKIRAVKPV